MSDLEQMLEAITTSKCEEGFSLEGLELLGDAFLEVSVSERLFLVHNKMQEGKLSKLRTDRICNAKLERLGRERGIMVSTSYEDTTLFTFISVCVWVMWMIYFLDYLVHES